jgi:hypothetical protein
MVPARPTHEWLQEHTSPQEVSIWDYDTDSCVCQDEINGMFAEIFKKPVEFVGNGPTSRILRGNGAQDVLGREESTDFLDGLPLLLLLIAR